MRADPALDPTGAAVSPAERSGGVLDAPGERVVPPRATDPSGMRSYEIHQRLRPHECPTVVARQLWSGPALTDPVEVLAELREQTPCFRDWVGNTYWVTRYDDVTSVFVDDANYETRTVRWTMGIAHRGRDLGHLVPVQRVLTDRADADIGPIIDALLDRLAGRDGVDLSVEIAARVPIELWARALGQGCGGDETEQADQPGRAAEIARIARWIMALRRATSWDPRHRSAALAAFDELAGWGDHALDEARGRPHTDDPDDLIGLLAGGTLDEDWLGGRPATGEDLAATVVEADHRTLHGGLANLWWALLTHPDQLLRVLEEPRLVRFAWYETLRHSPPVTTAVRWTRHEVERFGRLLPEGASVTLSALAANRDPRQFADPDRFDLGRLDLCQREPRGQYRADGLPAGVAFGFGAPSRFPAEPEDRPRSRYASTRDIAMAVTTRLLERHPELRIAPGSEPVVVAHEPGGMRICWSLPAELGR